MKNDVKKVYDDYYNEIEDLPSNDLGKIIYSKQKKYLNGLVDGSNRNLSSEILEIIDNADFYKRIHLIHQMYNATYEHSFWNNENWHIYHKKIMILLSLKLLFNIESFKSISDALTRFKKNEDTEELVLIEGIIHELINRNMTLIEPSKGDLANLKDVLDGKKEEKELYRPIEDWKYLEHDETGLKETMEEIYQNENIFKELYSNEDNSKHTSCVISDFIDSNTLNNEKSLFSHGDNKTNKFVNKLSDNNGT